MTLQLKPLTLYLARNGAIIGPLKGRRERDTTYPWEDPAGEHWTDDGKFLRDTPNPQDLICELAPGVGEALREIHRQVAATGRLPTAPQGIVYPDGLKEPAQHRFIIPDDLGDEPDQLTDDSWLTLPAALEVAQRRARETRKAIQIYRLMATVERETIQKPVEVITARAPGGQVISQRLLDGIPP